MIFDDIILRIVKKMYHQYSVFFDTILSKFSHDTTVNLISGDEVAIFLNENKCFSAGLSSFTGGTLLWGIKVNGVLLNALGP